jgi:hypothetical protein
MMPKETAFCEQCYEPLEDCTCGDPGGCSWCERCDGDRMTCDCEDEVLWSDEGNTVKPIL